MSTPQKDRREWLSRPGLRILTIAIVLTLVYSLLIVPVIGLDTPEKVVAVFGLVIMILMVSVASAMVAEHVTSRRRESALESIPVPPQDRRAPSPFVGFRASGRGWRMSAIFLIMSLFALTFVVGPLPDIYMEAGFPEALRWLMAVLFAACVSASIVLLKKRSIAVDGIGVRCEGRLLRNFNVPWSEVAMIKCVDVTLFFMSFRKGRPARNYTFKTAEGRMLGFIDPYVELKSSDAQEIERALFEQAAAHKISIR